MSNLLFMELCGSVTYLEPLRPEQWETASGGAVSFDMLSALLAEYGLDAGKLVFAPGRTILSIYYADFDRGLYCEITPKLDNFTETHRIRFQALAQKGAPINRRLRDREWRSYYDLDVPLSLQAYDFQRRLYELEPDQAFRVWYRIYKRLSYSNGVWRPETLEYVFSRAPAGEKPETGPGGLITLYRGMGALSSPPEEAISWSTHPGNALWFAVHSGRGTHLVTGEAAPDDVVFYSPGYSDENEVLVRPHTVRNIKSADMLPANQDTFIRLAEPMLMEFIALGRQALRFGYSKGAETFYRVHNVHHILRVLFLALVYFYHSEDSLTPEDKAVLIYFSILHDVARESEGIEDAHGDAAVEAIHKRGLRIKGVRLSKKDYRIAELIIRYHCRDDAQGLLAIQSAGWLSHKEKERAAKLYRICKDMDGLDRVRFNGLDYRMLRTPFAARLPLIAGCLLQEDILGFLEME